MESNICIFTHLKNQVPKKDEKMYTCKHGITLNWETARRILGLSIKKDEINS